ncbi:hypothetical protein [Ureaplasma canigenitalium]|uniref:hypothetical protein n=1 Tax=Ureaplasma canigenitalium TaxID=42092 RepID=UPI0004E1D723|nr:hypothetical protein [Ureaplasma canigenitalium]
MKKSKRVKLLLGFGLGTIALLTPIVAASCSSAATPGVPHVFVGSTNKDANIRVNIRIPTAQNSAHEIIFKDENNLLKEYYQPGDLTYITNKDGLRIDKNSQKIDQDGYVLDEKNERKLVWKNDLEDKSKSKNIPLTALQNEVLREIYNPLTFDSINQDNPNQVYFPTNFQVNGNLNTNIYTPEKQSLIEKKANAFNTANIAEAVYVYLSSFTDELFKYLTNLLEVDKSPVFNNQVANDDRDEFIRGLFRGVGSGKFTYKINLYNISFDISKVNATNGASRDLPKFGTKLTDDEILDPNKRLVMYKISNIKLQYAWYDSSNKRGGDFIVSSSNKTLNTLNKHLSVDDASVYKDGTIKNLVYDIPLKDQYFLFKPGIIRVNEKLDALTQKQRENVKTINPDIKEEDLNNINIYREYYTGLIEAVSPFQILGKDLKEDIKKQQEFENEKFVEDQSINNADYVDHNNGLHGVYPYAFSYGNQVPSREDFIKSKNFVEYIKKGVLSKNLKKSDKNNKLNLLKKALIGLNHSDVTTLDIDTLYSGAIDNLRNFVLDLDQVKGANVTSNTDLGRIWNDKSI